MEQPLWLLLPLVQVVIKLLQPLHLSMTMARALLGLHYHLQRPLPTA
jgi:hypothetical protein